VDHAPINYSAKIQQSLQEEAVARRSTAGKNAVDARPRRIIPAAPPTH
jgi:hypothetical protein